MPWFRDLGVHTASTQQTTGTPLTLNGQRLITVGDTKFPNRLAISAIFLRSLQLPKKKGEKYG